jgi:DNA-binding response OmpR family regulator
MHTSESLITNERLRQPAPIDYDPVTSLAVSPFEADLSFLQRMFDEADWKLFTAHTYKEGMAQLSRELIPVVLCECQLPDGNWKDVLSRLAPMLEPPRLIAVSHHADERLWLEVLNLGGFDLLATPFREVEAGYAIGAAWLDWKHARHQGALRRTIAAESGGGR